MVRTPFPRLGDRGRYAGLDSGQVTVETTHVAEELDRESFPFDPDRLDGPDAAQQSRRMISRQSARRTTWPEFPQRRMQPTGSLGSSRDKIVVTANE